MEAIILAGGFGTRLRTVVPDAPKPMAPVAGRPFLELLLQNLSRQGVRRVVLSLGYKAEVITNHFGHRYRDMALAYTIEDAPLGTGGAVRQALAHCHSDRAVVLNGDTYLEVEISRLEDLWQRNGQPLIVAREVADTTRYGRLEAKNDQVMRFAEKAASGPGLINVGCYLFPKHLLDAFPLGQPFSLEQDFLVEAVQRASFGLLVTRGRFIDIGVPEDYARAQVELAAL